MEKRTPQGAESDVLIAQSQLALERSRRLIGESDARLLDLVRRTERDSALGGGYPEQPTTPPWS